MQLNPSLILTLWQQWRQHCALVRSRRALLNLSAHQLHDVGLSEADALREAWRPIWDARVSQPVSTLPPVIDLAVSRGANKAARYA